MHKLNPVDWVLETKLKNETRYLAFNPKFFESFDLPSRHPFDFSQEKYCCYPHFFLFYSLFAWHQGELKKCLPRIRFPLHTSTKRKKNVCTEDFLTKDESTLLNILCRSCCIFKALTEIQNWVPTCTHAYYFKKKCWQLIMYLDLHHSQNDHFARN